MDNLNPLLKGVSRSFYLSLAVLPEELRPQISTAYLLARASDTVADTKAVPREDRLNILKRMRRGDFASVGGVVDNQALPAEQELLSRLDEVSSVKASFSADDRGLIDRLLDTIISGQIFDLERFPGEDASSLTALSEEADLDRYTYLVAGCVGEFWTRMCGLHLPALKGWDTDETQALGVRFGKGLQLVNVLRDIPRDLRNGRCYLPSQAPRDLLDPGRFPAVQPLYTRLLDLAAGHLEAGWRYTLSIPPSLWNLRLACVWPIWIGLETLALLRRGNPLDPGRAIMVPQWRTNLLLGQSFLLCRSNSLLNRSFQSRLVRASGRGRRNSLLDALFVV
ncbi:MAG: squalene/phytoene synthase family protein [Elusimicrobia bacterium]|nr:squalene/phytoene synthase family protein [Elusimicrobiota bacterium]